jgi:hypothetical protein
LLEDGIGRKRLLVVVAGAVVEMKTGAVDCDLDWVKVAVFVWPWWDVGEGIAVQGIVDDFGNRSLEVVGVAGRAAGSVGDYPSFPRGALGALSCVRLLGRGDR